MNIKIHYIAASHYVLLCLLDVEHEKINDLC
jgi:hypothetical protein